MEIFGLRFSNCTFKKRFVAAGLGGRETVQVAYAPECMDTVWLYENGTYSAFDLVQKAYLGKSLAEIADAQQLEKVERTDWKKQELQAQLDLMSDIQAIADCSERTMPDRSNISKQIQRNRSTARKQESVSLMDYWPSNRRTISMHADYIVNPLYDNNPFIEALPPMLSGRDLIHALAVIPPYSDSDRDRSTGERLQLLSSLYEFYQPLSMTIDLYCEVYTAMQHCYGQYSIQSEAAAMQNGYSMMHGNALAASIGGGNSFSVIGVSGLGKSTALQRVLSLYPQVIEHTVYHGQKFYCHQIPYLVVQTPHDASIKALILDIYLQIDSLIGTCYQKDALSRRLSIDVLVSQLNQIVRVNHIGLLVIDELQNITYHKSDGGIRFLNFLVHLINGAGVSVCMVGTPRVLQVLQQEFRAARRTTGLVYDRLPNDKEFSLLLHGLWYYQYTQYVTDLTPELTNWLYRKTQGIPDILSKLLYNAKSKLFLMDAKSST